MIQESVAVSWENWDWRAFARVVTWVLIAALWARWRGVALWACATGLLCNVVLLSLLSFGILAHIFALVAMGAIRAALFLDEAAYTVSERLVRSLTGTAPFAVQFWTAFSAEIALFLGAAWIWRMWALGPRFMAVLMEVKR